jgi:hypothetical protein
MPHFGDSCKRNIRYSAYTPHRGGHVLPSRESRSRAPMSARTVWSWPVPPRCLADIPLRTLAIMPRLRRHVWLCGLGFCVGQCWRPLAWRLGLVLAAGPHEAAAQEIEARPAKHLAFQQFQTIDVPLDGTRAPGQGDTRFDRFIVLREPGAKRRRASSVLVVARLSHGSSCIGCRWRTRVAKSWARSIASATSAACAWSWVSWWTSASVRLAARRSTSQVARRGVKG